jgi:hypothetical protein
MHADTGRNAGCHDGSRAVVSCTTTAQHWIQLTPASLAERIGQKCPATLRMKLKRLFSFSFGPVVRSIALSNRNNALHS